MRCHRMDMHAHQIVYACVCRYVEGRMLIHIENHNITSKSFWIQLSCKRIECTEKLYTGMDASTHSWAPVRFAGPLRARQANGTDMRGAKWNWKRLKLRGIDVICSMIWSDQRDIRKYGTKHDTCRKLTHAILRPNKMNEAVKATYARIKRNEQEEEKNKNGRKIVAGNTYG